MKISALIVGLTFILFDVTSATTLTFTAPVRIVSKKTAQLVTSVETLAAPLSLRGGFSVIPKGYEHKPFPPYRVTGTHCFCVHGPLTSTHLQDRFCPCNFDRRYHPFGFRLSDLGQKFLDLEGSRYFALTTISDC